MKYVRFSPEEKIKLFDKIASCFYESNFGRMSKADIELMMFHFYIEKMVESHKEADGTIDYRLCSDYRISKELGITQQRVRNLKIKNQLAYPIDFDWKVALSTLIPNARYDKVSKKVSLNIPDPILYLEIQNFLEERGAYVEVQRNGKILQLRVEYFIDLIVVLEDESSRHKILKMLKKEFKKLEKDNCIFDESNIGKSLVDGAVNITSIVSNLSTLISPQNTLGSCIINFLLQYANSAAQR